MRRALQLARRALGGVGPRAPVGAVIVKNNRIVGEGATEALPGDHAEVVAMRHAGEAARGATLYCTLEPHAHQSSVPPCTEAIIRAGLARVVCALQDPNPQVNGAGYARLRAAGIQVQTDVSLEIRAEAEEVVEGFVHYLRTRKPLVIAKYAMTIDGKIATRTGQSKWITGEAARARVHEMRAAADAVMVGVGTVLTDDPRLNARVPWAKELGAPRPRLRVVLDTNGRLPERSAMLGEPGGILWIRGEGAPKPFRKPGLEAIEAPRAGRWLDLEAVMSELGNRGCTAVLVEGGATLLGGLFDAGLVDRVAAFIAPKVFGGTAALPAISGTGVATPEEAVKLERVRIEVLGEDFLITGYVAGPEDPALRPAQSAASPGARRSRSPANPRARPSPPSDSG
ncbi:MAG: bifunctional diaminohydroxyphosphoribosylaminopyrimidine deaminase/5-amino-6-(5-phosphoribosylamino)uracil reductase RibD [Chloroflexi bacterium]|nr:bifunctional diaminohydroxyphosphoribosylaminopyrimidine deaminase/5-amino-6-(5-phosphoribosylamino)uracil reductase RibD [Chloroflexota bacterium]